MTNVDLASIEQMVAAIDEALDDRIPVGGWAAQSAVDNLTASLVTTNTNVASRALQSDLTAAIASLNASVDDARDDANTAVSSLTTNVNARVPQPNAGTAGGVALLGPDGKLLDTMLPNLAVSEVFPVNSQAEMVALNAQPGDMALRQDLIPLQTFILVSTPATSPGNWRNITPPGSVVAVDGMTGSVQLGSTTPVADSLARRLADGRLQAAPGVSGSDVVTFSQADAFTQADTALSGRITTEGNDRAAADTALSDRITPLESSTTITQAPLVANYAHYVDPTVGWNGLSYWRSGKVVTLSGAFSASSARPANEIVVTLPAGVRPPTTLYVLGSMALTLRADGTLRLPNAGMASGAIATFTCSYVVGTP